MQPNEWRQLKAFRELIQETIDTLKRADNQTTLGRALDEVAPRWKGVDDGFAATLEDLRKQVWQVAFSQVRHLVGALVGHLEAELPALDDQLRGG